MPRRGSSCKSEAASNTRAARACWLPDALAVREKVTRRLTPPPGVSLAPRPARYPCREPNMDRLNRYNSELNLAVWAALLVVALLLGR